MQTTPWELGLGSPFCTICTFLADTGGRFACAAFPFGIPAALYPGGCGPRGEPGFKPRPGMQEAARRWSELDGLGMPQW